MPIAGRRVGRAEAEQVSGRPPQRFGLPTPGDEEQVGVGDGPSPIAHATRVIGGIGRTGRLPSGGTIMTRASDQASDPYLIPLYLTHPIDAHLPSSCRVSPACIGSFLWLRWKSPPVNPPRGMGSRLRFRSRWRRARCSRRQLRSRKATLSLVLPPLPATGINYSLLCIINSLLGFVGNLLSII